MIKRLLITIPMKMENPIKPCLYSFFQGLKKVFNIRGKEKALKKALSKEIKNLTIFFGASMYQNFKKMKGNDNIPRIGSTFSLGY